MAEASPMWQGGMFLFAILFLVFEVWRGWRAGFARAGINFSAIVISTVVGLFAAQMVAAPFGGFKDPGGFIAGAVAGIGLGLFVFLVLWLTGIIFFKRTDHQATGVFRLFWGAGGAFFGMLMGLLILWGGISMIRSLGALAEARVQIAKDSAAPAAPVTPAGQGTQSVPAAPATAPSTPPPLAVNLLKLKESLEMGPAGKFVESVDLLPADFYELVVQTGRISGDPQALMRFVEYPGIQELMRTPKMVDLLNDPKIVQASTEQNVTALLTNPKLRAAVEDPAFAEQLKKIDLRAALKFALEKPTPTPSPSPHTTKKPSVPARD
jgi:hypothetical protein